MTNTGYKRYMLILLMAILAFNYADRLALGIVLENIKADLHLSDTQLGFMGGISFALFYSVMGIPIARWADRGNRVLIITVTTALWSAMVALCGVAGSFAQLLLIRVGVAVGEAGCFPPAQSLIADYFTRAERPRAVGIYTAGASLSFVFGYLLAGWLNEFYGWRVTFIALGLPGLGLAALAWLTLREPRRASGAAVLFTAQPSVKEVLMTLWANVTFRRLLICLAISSFFMYGILQWEPAFFIRSYGMNTGEIGTWIMASSGISNVLGNFWGGALASRYAANNERLQMRAMAVLYGCAGILHACAWLAESQYWAFAFLGLGSMALASTNGPLFAAMQTLVTEKARAMSVAIVLLFSNLIGLGLGPLATGVLSDVLRPGFGEESLRYGLLLLCPGFLLCAGYMWKAGQTVAADLQTVRP